MGTPSYYCELPEVFVEGYEDAAGDRRFVEDGFVPWIRRSRSNVQHVVTVLAKHIGRSAPDAGV